METDRQFDRTERRILGSLVEKKLSTPEQYPLTLNALVLACNQKSNRDPVLTLETFEVEGALRALRMKGLVSVNERDGGRVTRYSERLSEKLAIGEYAGAILAELMLRGPQTESELFRRGKRMTSFGSPAEITDTIRSLSDSRLVFLLPKGSGQRHARYDDRLKFDAPPAPAQDEPAPSVPVPAATPTLFSEPAPAPEPAPGPGPTPPLITESASVSETPSEPVSEPESAPPRPADPESAPPRPADPVPDPVLEPVDPEPGGLHAEIAALREVVEDLKARLDRLEGL